MDELFKSLNVGDLLSAGDISDHSSPLSAPDLRLLINRLDSHSLHIKSKVRSHLISHRHDLAAITSLSSGAVRTSGEVSGDVADLLRLLSGDGEINEIVREMNVKRREVKEKREILGLVGAIVGIGERLEEVGEAVRDGRLRFAAGEVRDLKVAVRFGDEEEVEGEPVVYGLLRKEWLRSFEEIQEVLGRFLEDAVRFDRESNRVHVKYQLSVDGIGGVDLRSVLEAMDDIGILDYGLSKVGHLMINSVIVPVINGGSSISSVEELTGEITEATLKMIPSAEDKMENVYSEAIFSGIIQVIKFISKCICLQDGSWTQRFGRLTWPRISELIISNCLSKVVPDDASKLTEFQNIIKLTSEFEKALKELRFISASDSADERLSSYADNVELHFASRKKIEILAKARNLLLQCDFLVPKESNKAVDSSDCLVDLLFLSERCVVSNAASQLMKLVHQTLQDVCLSSPRVAMEFYRAARDALLLYEAIVPVKLERRLDSVNQAAILMHNDCLYLSQEILGLAFEINTFKLAENAPDVHASLYDKHIDRTQNLQYRSDFPGSIKEQTVFVDMAPRFHMIAEQTLRKQIQLVITNLKEAIDGADGFQNTHQNQQFESAKFSIDQVVFILEKVHIIWEPLLQPLTYKRCMCTVMESVFSRIAKDILLLDDMAAEETLQLQRLIHVMLESLFSLFESLNTISQNGKALEDYIPPLDSLIPSLLKIRKLADLLDMPLKSILTTWESGELVSAGFTIEEMEDFIKAIFTDSPLRKECLWRIKSSSF